MSENNALSTIDKNPVTVLGGLRTAAGVEEFVQNYPFDSLSDKQKDAFVQVILATLETQANKRKWYEEDVEPSFTLKGEVFASSFDQLIDKLVDKDAKNGEAIAEASRSMAIARVINKQASAQDVEIALDHVEAFQIALKDQHTSLSKGDFKEAIDIAAALVTQTNLLSTTKLGSDVRTIDALKEVLEAGQTKFPDVVHRTEHYQFGAASVTTNARTFIADQAKNILALADLDNKQINDLATGVLRQKAMQKLTPEEQTKIEGKFTNTALLERTAKQVKQLTGGSSEVE